MCLFAKRAFKKHKNNNNLRNKINKYFIAMALAQRTHEKYKKKSF